MQADYCQTSDAHAAIKTQLLAAIDEKIMIVFQQIKANRYAKMEEFYDLLVKRKNIGGLQSAFKEKFYKTLLQQEIHQFNFIKNLDHYTLKVLRLIKCQIKDFKVDWREIIGKLERSDKATNKVARLHSFLKYIREYYDENNAMDVFKHFLGRYNLGDEMVWIYMEYFINLTKNTKPEIAAELLVELKEIYKYEDVKELCYYRWLLKIKRKLPQVILDGTYLDELNHSILNELTLLQSKAKGSIGGTLTSKFLTNVFAKFIGKTNPKSVQMINWLFKIFESGVSAFEDKKVALKVLKNFFKPLWARKTKEDRLRKKLEKKDSDQDDEEDKKDKEKQKDKDKDQGDRSDLADLLDSLGTLILEDSDDDDEDDQIDETLPVEEKQKIRQEQLTQLQADQLTPEIMNALKTNIEMILQDIFFTPNKQVSNLLKYIYFLFPDLAQKSIEFLAKGMDITEMNFSIHMKNTKKIVQYLLVFGERDRLMENMLTILSEMMKIRYVKDAWHVLSYVIMKIPCLDEEDYKKVPEDVKDRFEKNFKIDHDVFYERYSELMFQFFKKFIKEIEAKEKKTIFLQDNPFIGFAYNVYPQFSKRILELTISNYIETPNSFIFNYLELKTIPQKHIESFLPELKVNLTSDQLKNKFRELLIASRNLPFDRLSKIIHEISNYESNQRMGVLLDIIKVYFQENIWMSPLYKPLESSLEYLWNPEAKYQIELRNCNQQQVEDSLKRVYGLWKQNYDVVSQFVQEHSKSLGEKIDPIEIVKKFYFTVGNPDFDLRKQLLCRLDVIDSIVDNLPGNNLVWQDSSILKDLKFKHFSSISQMRDKTRQLVEDLFHIAYIQFPHQQKILGKLCSMGILLSASLLENSDKYIEEYKDITKVIRANESKNHINYFLILMREIQKYLAYVAVETQLKQSQKDKRRMSEFIELALLHPDQNGEIGPVSKSEDYDITDILLELLKMPPPAGIQPNRLKLFHQNLSKVLYRLFSKPRNVIPTQTLLQIMSLVITHITSSQKSIRQGYLSTLKRLLEIVEDTRINEKSLEIIGEELATTSSKQKLIWATGLVFLEDNITNYGKFYDMLNNLLFSDDFLIRKYSQFLLSYIIRSDRKKHAKETTLTDLGEYKQKSLDEFLETGYLRPEHIDTNIKFKKILMKYRSYYSCVIKQKRIDKQSLSFIFDSQKSLKFLKQYQTDQVSSEDELKLKKKASFSSQFSQLSDIFTWLKSRYSKLLDISEHKFTSYESIFGQRFFKYIFETDFHNGFPFFNATHQFIQNVCIPNLQTLDNQVVVLNYLSTLLGAYSKFHRTIKSEAVEAFIMRTTGEIIEKSSGQFFNFFKKISLLHIDELPLLVKFFQKYPPTHPNFYRTVEIRLIWFSHKRQQLVQILNDIFKAGKNLQNSNVSKLLKLIITFNETHYFNDKQINECNIINLKELIEKNDVVKQTDHIYTAHRKEFDDILLRNLSKLISSQKLEDRKSGNDLLNNAIVSYSFLQKTEANVKTLNIFLNMAVDIVVNNKEEFSNEEDPLEDTIVILLSSVYPEQTFPTILQTLKKLIVPLPKVINYLNKFVKYPYNMLRMSEENYESFIKKLLTLLENNLNFKQLLTTISSFLYFRRLKQEDVSKLVSSPRQITTYNMALLLSDVRNINKYETQLSKVINSKQKDKIKIWATIMINSRGKREILQDEETHTLWRSIKDVSNPYFYHC